MAELVCRYTRENDIRTDVGGPAASYSLIPVDWKEGNRRTDQLVLSACLPRLPFLGNQESGESPFRAARSSMLFVRLR